MRLVDRFPGGRWLIFAPMLLLLALGLTILPKNSFIQIDNAVIFVIGCAILSGWRGMVTLFIRERQEAYIIWLSLGVFTIVSIALLQSVSSYLLRAFGFPLDGWISETLTAIWRFFYAFGFGCLYLVPQARDDVVPPRGWATLFIMVGVTTALVLIGMWLF